MGASVRALRRRRQAYALSARRQRALRRVRLPGAIAAPRVIVLPRGVRLERRAYLFWRIRLPLWAVLSAAGWLIIGWLAAVLGLGVAVLAEIVFSYRVPRGARPLGTCGGPPGPGAGPSGVREPRRPKPTGGLGAAQLPLDAESLVTD